jgi:hypothetical protein
LATVSATSNVVASNATTRQRPKNAPTVSASATGRQTRANNSRIGSTPTRCRAFQIAADVGTFHGRRQRRTPRSPSVSSRKTSS